MAKISIAVIMGGPSREHEISVKTGAAVLAALSADKYMVTKVYISLTGDWSIDNGRLMSSTEALAIIKETGINIIFLALHGSFGEDGTVQALLERYNLCYTGSPVAASLLAMDKIIAGELFVAHGLKTPKSLCLTRYEIVRQSTLLEDLKGFNYPIIVKPAQQGSSVGVTLVSSPRDLLQAINFALEHDNKIIVQEYIRGRELSCGVLEEEGSTKTYALPPTELRPKGADFFDYYAKYTSGITDEITPPDMSPNTINDIQSVAIKAHNLLGCSGYSRTDMILKQHDLYIIETNTLPGLTEMSILPQQAKEAGLTFAELLDRVIVSGLRKTK